MGEVEHSDRIKVLEDDAGARAAKEVDRTSRLDVYSRSRNQHGRAQASRPQEQDRPMNIVIHGLDIAKEDEIMKMVLDMCQAMDAIVFSSDIIDIDWLGHFEAGLPRPPPLRVAFQFQYQRNDILRKISRLQSNPSSQKSTSTRTSL